MFVLTINTCYFVNFLKINNYFIFIVQRGSEYYLELLQGIHLIYTHDQ